MWAASAAVLASADMFDLKRDEWKMLLPKPAVFAAVVRALADQEAKFRVHSD